MDPYSSPYNNPNSSPHNPFLDSLLYIAELKCLGLPKRIQQTPEPGNLKPCSTVRTLPKETLNNLELKSCKSFRMSCSSIGFCRKMGCSPIRTVLSQKSRRVLSDGLL